MLSPPSSPLGWLAPGTVSSTSISVTSPSVSCVSLLRAGRSSATTGPGCDLVRLWSHGNAARDGGRQLLRGGLLGAVILVRLPCPVLASLGEKVSATSSALKKSS